MSPEQGALLDKARRSLAAARGLAEGGHDDFAVSRDYYAMLYAAQAVLLTQGLSFSKHSAAISAFGRNFVKTGLFDPEHHSALRQAFDARNVADYGHGEPPSAEMVREVHDRAVAFVDEADRYLRRPARG